MKKDNNGVIKSKDKFSIEKNGENNLYSLVFPNENVKELADSLFLKTLKIKGENLQEVCIPSTIEIIGNKCFKDCTNLEDVTIPDTITKLGNACFRGCKNLKNVRLPRSITVLPEYLFTGCTSLNKIYIPDNVTTLLDSCFSNCINLKSITLPETISQMGESVFSNCISLKSFTCNNNITYINNDLFRNCENLEAVTLPIALKSIGRNAFLSCCKLQNIEFPHTLNTIGENAFEESFSLKEITIPNSVTQIGSEAFYNCRNLEKVTILPDMLHLSKKTVTIQDSAFSGCTNIKSLSLPKGGLDNENAFDFSYMPNLKSINYAGRNILDLSEGEKFNNLLYNGRLIYIEYTDESNQVVSKVLEDSISNKRDIKSVELTDLFNKLVKHDILQKKFKFDNERNKMCLNMLSTLDYETCVKLLDLLQERKKLDSSDNNGKLNKKEDLKHVRQTKKEKQREAERKTKIPLLKKFKNRIMRFFNKKHDNNSFQTSEKINTVEFLETLFKYPKTVGNVSEFTQFFADNMKAIVDITSSETLENLAQIQRNFQEFTKNPILKKRIRTCRLSLSDALQYKNLYNKKYYIEEFARLETEGQKAEEYHKNLTKTLTKTDNFEL